MSAGPEAGRLFKYPRTQHIEGSRLQEGDQDLDAVPWSDLRGKRLVIEEKIDGANSAISFEGGELRLQSRGHYLTGGGRERHFALLKTWAAAHAPMFQERLEDRYVMYGEWVYAKHTIFYDRLPHYFLEFDVLDKQSGTFLSTEARRELLQGLPIASVPVLADEEATRHERLAELVRPSVFQSPDWRERLDAVSRQARLDVDRVRRQTDGHDLSEGLYVKWECDGRVLGRFKFVRASFLQSVEVSDSHWLSRPIVQNQLADGVDLFASSAGSAS